MKGGVRSEFHSAGRLCVDKQSQDSVASYSGYRRKQQQHPVESLNEPAVAMNTVPSFAYPVASSTHPVIGKSSRELQYPVAGSTDARYPVDKYTAVARSVVTKNKQQLSEQLLNNQLKNIQPLQAINAQDGKNQWLRFSRAISLNSREQDLYYSGK
ncbi:hypothetical protein F511_18256 [Dorcoceras hygrometricum]|uniref:Uncharacterized protein n=1 Tax=Dorcoceras hygrometricum TaxID=472368 RepID=A0A2Z7B9C3_9LAMI|nr:hypothetical protein F511_18256 [Dorcoceras hygrometricum]